MNDQASIVLLRIEELSVSVVCGNPSCKPSFISGPNNLFQFGKTSNWLLIILQFLEQRKRKGCVISMHKSKISGLKLSIIFFSPYFHIIILQDLTAIMKQYSQIVFVYTHFYHSNDI